MPYYMHLLATATAEATMLRASDRVTRDDLRDGLNRAARDADQALREDYKFSILSPKGSDIHRRIVWVMASSDGISQNVGAISADVNLLAETERAPAVSPQAVGQALRKLQSDEKRCILESRLTGIVRFRNPLMKGFVRVARAVAENV
jgi:hypothetical protein